jgi:predicted acylesterase/phospholipase RssA
VRSRIRWDHRGPWGSAVLVGAVCAVAGGAWAAEAPSPAPQRYSLTVRGGVSLGAYEGGINWALLKVLKDDPSVSLTTVTGASAGNINAFLSAIEWCQSATRSGQESVRNNLFWQAWVPVGIHGLFPRRAKGYQPGDGLFTRTAFASAEDAFRKAVDDGGRFGSPCGLHVGVSVTRVRSADIVIRSVDAQSGNDGIHIPSQRFVATFGLDVGAKGLRFRQLNQHDHEVGEYLTLPSTDGVVSDDQLIELIHASSAFPVAFGPQIIRHCPDDAELHGGARCSPPIADQFIDGGVFDNVPLGLAVSLTEQLLAPADAEQVHYVYIDPDHARSYAPLPMPPPERPETKRVGLSTTFDFIKTFVSVSQQYELQGVARYLYKPTDGGQANGAKTPPATPLPRLTSRLQPLMGSYLAHFGAFFAEPFREHDFYVGVYDGLVNAAREKWNIHADGRPLTEEEAIRFARLSSPTSASASASFPTRRARRSTYGWPTATASPRPIRRRASLFCGCWLTSCLARGRRARCRVVVARPTRRSPTKT